MRSLTLLLCLTACGDPDEDATHPEAPATEAPAEEASPEAPAEEGPTEEEPTEEEPTETPTEEEPTEEEPTNEPTPFDRVATEVLGATCSSQYCHGGWSDDLVEHTGTGLCDGQPLVVPGDPEASLLWRKVAPGVEVCGNKMPGPQGLPPEQAELIRTWILGMSP